MWVEMQKPDYSYWLNKPFWTQEQAEFLLFDIDPDNNGNFFPIESRSNIKKAIEYANFTDEERRIIDDTFTLCTNDLINDTENPRANELIRQAADLLFESPADNGFTLEEARPRMERYFKNFPIGCLVPDDSYFNTLFFKPINIIGWAIDYFICPDAFYIWYKANKPEQQAAGADQTWFDYYAMKCDYWLSIAMWTPYEAASLLCCVAPEYAKENKQVAELQLRIERLIDAQGIKSANGKIAPEIIIKWALDNRLTVPAPLVKFSEQPPETPPQEIPTSQQAITIADLAKLFDTPTPTLEQVAAQYFGIKTKKEANRKLALFRTMFEAQKPKGANKFASYLVNLESLAAHLNKSPFK